ncbi:hypothetical protein AMURIS_04366 [Acetatifactor muris]|uniref:Uncharacterized protein n=1 Tax=Acetatifactor muris TaxID=879566 RepID=A0A2K4ZMK5_9FIRM|nr:hypothetical protein AMURIS_04366 [Acetatifactor muris]
MSITDNVQIAEENINIQKNWTIEEIESVNNLSSFQKINERITSLFMIVNIGIVVYAVFFLIAKKPTWSYRIFLILLHNMLEVPYVHLTPYFYARWHWGMIIIINVQEKW